MPGDKRKKKVRGAAVIKKAKNIIINIKTGAKRSGAKRNAAPVTAPQLARTAINIAVSQQQQQQQQQQQGQFVGIPFRARPPSSGTNVVATYKSPLARLAPPPAAPIIIQQAAAAPIKKEKEDPKPDQPTDAQQALTRRVGQLEQYGRQIYTMVAPIVAEGGSVRRRASQHVSIHANNDDVMSDSSVSVNVPRPLIAPSKYAGLVQQSAPRISPAVSASEQAGFETANQDIQSDPQAHFAAQYIYSAAALEKGGRGRPKLTQSQLEARAADKAAAKKPRGAKAGVGWSDARRAAHQAKKLLTGMPMQTQEQAAAVMQADVAPLLKPRTKAQKNKKQPAVLNPALSGSDQVSQLAQAGAAAAAPKLQSSGRSIEQLAARGGGASSNDSFHSSFDL
jgi:hypothetical protein